MRIVPTKRIDWSGGFTAETEKYSGQVGLDSDDYIVNYVAGMPFPTVGDTDPKAAIKIAYNWHMGPFMPDDFSLEPSGFGLTVGPPTPSHLDFHSTPSSSVHRVGLGSGAK